ncbi:MAG: class I SAM-dependent methyltransferase, partial [Ignavibacteriales bacterium]
MNENKDHWYDGWFYDKFIAPNQDKLFGEIKNLIEPDSKVIDVGCGTGRFPFFIADKCKSVLGIDISKRNIDRANLNLLHNPHNKISFKHTALNKIIANDHFDYAVSTYVIHELHEKERINLLRDMSEAADKIIIGDYLYPNRTGLWNILNEAVEFAAGKNHYKNYKNYMANGGIKILASRAGLKLIAEHKDQPLTSHLVILSK